MDNQGPLTRRLRTELGSVVRLAPGGEFLLRLSRRSAAAARRRFRPMRPSLLTPEAVAALSETAEDHPFITGNRLAARCRYVINYDDLIVNEDIDNDWWFCRADFIEYFFAEHEPAEPFVLFSHNSDRPVDPAVRRFLRRPRLRAWFAA